MPHYTHELSALAKKQQKHSFKTLLFEFVNSTSIHGVQHLRENSRHAIERLLWSALLVAAAAGALAVSGAAWTRYRDAPCVIAMERDYREWNTSLPAGTLCPYDRLDPAALHALVNELSSGRSSAERRLLASFITDLTNATYSNFESLTKYLHVPHDLLPAPDQYLGLINKVKANITFDVSTTLERSPVFITETVTELGLCWAFNAPFAAYNALSYWKSNSWAGLPHAPTLHSHPLTGEVYVQVTNMNNGYQFILHATTEVADVAERIYNSEKATYNTLELTALQISSSAETRSLRPSQRGCRLAREPESSALAPVYAYSLCRMQCRAALALRLCNCVPHFYRPTTGTKICDVSGLVCLGKHSQSVIQLRNETTGKKVACGCLPPCDFVNYIPENVRAIPWDLGTNIKWGMKKYPRMRLKRNILFGFTDLLVSIGGAGGLMLGCSLLGCLEVIYFVSLRCGISLSHGRRV